MRLLKRILIVLFVLVTLIILGSWAYINNLKPTYEGASELENLQSETTVYFDDFGIPHIYAQNEIDAIRTLGYVHAQDRLWQMELMRRIAPGRLSEIFGKDMLKNDKFFKTVGIDEASEKIIKKLDKNSQTFQLTQAYLNGVNQFMDEGPTPIEFILIGVEKEHYQLKDVYNILGYMSFSFAMAQKTDPLLSVLKEKLSEEYLKDLNITVNPNSTLIHNTKEEINDLEEIVASIHDVMNTSPIPPFIGSNSWVVSGNKTKSGKVLFANDPHIAYSQPATWFEAHISTPTYEMYGYHIAGVPFPLLGHNRKYAYGLTMLENDDLDFYQEENHKEDLKKYKSPNGFSAYKVSEKIINIKDEENITIQVKETRNGPIINNVLDQVSQVKPISMSWIYTKFDDDILEAVYTISHAKEMNDVKKGASLIHAPGLNIMYGDDIGNVAWWGAGKLYKHKSHVNTKFILDGTSGEDDPIEYLDFSENPKAENPEWNYVYSANNQPDSIAGILYPGYYLPEDRGKRIVELIAPKNDWTKEDYSKMINDVTSAVSPSIINEFTSIIDLNSFSKTEQKAIEILQNWDGSNTTDKVAPTIYNKWIYLYLKNTFEDEMGETVFNHLLNTHLIKRTIAEHIKRDTSKWWDNILTTEHKETKKDILAKSLIETVSSLENQLGKNIEQWTWDKVHTLEHKHPLGTVESLRSYFNVGPFPMKGAREVIDNRGYEYNNSGEYKILSGPSTRRIVDFSDIENSLSILPTGQSGNPFSKFYKDQVNLYNEGKFRKMKMNKEEIINTSTKLIFTPNNE